MNDAACGRHPLDIAGPDHAAVAGGIAMLHLTLIDDGDGLEAAVGMLANAALRRRWLEVMRPGVIEQQEGADMGAEVIVGEQRTHWEAVSHPVALIVAIAAEDLLRHNRVSAAPGRFRARSLSREQIATLRDRQKIAAADAAFYQ